MSWGVCGCACVCFSFNFLTNKKTEEATNSSYTFTNKYVEREIECDGRI